jgi:DNA-binding transcriptional LysR family regulator
MQSSGLRTQNIMRHLLYFLAVAEEEHFHKAAARLNITQPALSRHVNALEQELGTALFIRGIRSVTLTDAGRMIQELGARMLLQVDHAVSKLEAFCRGNEGTLRVGFNLGSGRPDVIIGAIQKYRKSYPNVHIELRSLFSQAQIDALTDESLDVAFVYDAGLKNTTARLDDTFETLPVTQQETRLCLYDGHPLLKKRKVTFAELRNETLIWPAQGLGSYVSDVLEKKFMAAGVKPNILVEAASADIALNIVGSRAAIGFAPYPHPRASSLHFRKVVGLDLKITLSMAWLRGSKSAPVRNFIETVRGGLQGLRNTARTPR